MSKDRDRILEWCREGHGVITKGEAHQMYRETLRHMGYAQELAKFSGSEQVFALRDHLKVCEGCRPKINVSFP